MTDEEFKKLLDKGSVGKMMAGLFLFAFGFIVLYSGFRILGHENSEFMSRFGYPGFVFVECLGALFFIIGCIQIFELYRTDFLIRKGRHKLVNAVLTNDQNYILWIYAKEIIKGKLKFKEYEVWLHACDGKSYMFRPENSDHTITILKYFTSKFPNAFYGDEAEKKQKYKEIIKQRKNSKFSNDKATIENK